MNEYLNKAKIEFDEKGILLLPDISKLKYEGELMKLNDPLTGIYEYNEIKLPEKLCNIIYEITGTKVNTGKVMQISKNNYKLISRIETKHFAILELTNDWDESFGGNISLADGNGEQLSVPFMKNSVFISKTYPFWYIEYCNHLAKGKRKVIVLEF